MHAKPIFPLMQSQRLSVSSQVLGSCNKTVVMRQACPQLALACLTACVRQLDSLNPDQLAQVTFTSSQTNLRLNLKGADQMRILVRAGVARAPAMSALSLTQFIFGAVALGNIKPAHMQVHLVPLTALSAACQPMLYSDQPRL